MAVLDWILKPKPVACQQYAASGLHDLAAIQDEQINLVYWKRPVNDLIYTFIENHVLNTFKHWQARVSWHDLNRQLTGPFNIFPDHLPGKSLLKHDLMELAYAFMQVTDSEEITMHVRVVTNDACTRFHMDGYPLRLLCTYYGAGTEWVPDEYVNRDQLMHGVNDAIVQNSLCVKRMDPFEVAILKGDPGFKTNRGIVHRSPSIETESAKRFLVRMDVTKSKMFFV
jgi:hypothetical protein